MTPPSTSCHGQKRRDTKKSVAEGVSTEDRLKLFRLIEKLAFESRDVVSNIHGGGSPETHKMMVLQHSDLEGKKKIAKGIAGIES